MSKLYLHVTEYMKIEEKKKLNFKGRKRGNKIIIIIISLTS